MRCSTCVIFFPWPPNFVVSLLDTGRVCSLAYTCKRTFDQLLNFLEVAPMFLTDVSPACYLRSSSLLTTRCRSLHCNLFRQDKTCLTGCDLTVCINLSTMLLLFITKQLSVNWKFIVNCQILTNVMLNCVVNQIKKEVTLSVRFWKTVRFFWRQENYANYFLLLFLTHITVCTEKR
jgi:hypothetical protein